MSELKACPFCGKQLEFFGHDIDRWISDDMPEEQAVEVYKHPNGTMEDHCALGGLVFNFRLWNRRPIEEQMWAKIVDVRVERDALQARIDDYMEAYAKVIGEQCPSDEHHCACVPFLRARIAELEAASRWIPVGERLPEPGHLVLAATKHIWLACVNSDGDWFNTRADRLAVPVTHWRPLPEPPTEAS